MGVFFDGTDFLVGFKGNQRETNHFGGSPKKDTHTHDVVWKKDSKTPAFRDATAMVAASLLWNWSTSQTILQKKELAECFRFGLAMLEASMLANSNAAGGLRWGARARVCSGLVWGWWG